MKAQKIKPTEMHYACMVDLLGRVGLLEEAEELIKSLLIIPDARYYTVLSNMYTEAWKWDEANRVKELMKLRGARKKPGCSWVHIQDQVHAFVAGERLERSDPTLWLA
ncbi:hypothetical protein V6N13_028619 [Hibiscus sabdariffa]|uniref:Pentatricopeptide repeat-containing protein n=1 Tax=Hibiscus sabdariffa TaxID=183260 RepID=A0ABR2P9H2_9ROSI